MASGESRYVTANGLRLHYVEWGSAASPPMVLLHGLRAYGHWFDEFAEAAAGRYRMIALDQRGRGASEWAKDGLYNTDAYVADLEGVVDALGIDRFVLVGHSMGGVNAIHYAARHPERVSALVVVDMAPELDPVGIQRIRRELGETPSAFASWGEARAFLRKLHVRPSDQHIQTRLQWMLREAPDGKIVWRIDGAIFNPRMAPDPPERLWTALKSLRCPTLFVRGALSDIVKAETVGRMLATVPGSRAAEVAEAGHMVVEDNPSGFNRAVLDYLTAIGG